VGKLNVNVNLIMGIRAYKRVPLNPTHELRCTFHYAANECGISIFSLSSSSIFSFPVSAFPDPLIRGVNYSSVREYTL